MHVLGFVVLEKVLEEAVTTFLIFIIIIRNPA